MKSATNFKSGLLLLFGLAAAACSEQVVPEAGPAALPQPDAAQELRIDPTVRELSEADVAIVAERFARQWADGGKRAVATRSGNLETIADTDGAPFAYVVNFDGGDFCIVGATKESYPVLAYDEHNALTIDGNCSGIAAWIDYTVEAAKYRTAEEAAAIARQWADYEALPAATRATDDDPARNAAFNEKMGSISFSGNSAFPLQFLLDNPSSSHVPDDILRNARILADQKSCPYQYFIIERVNRSTDVHIGPLLETAWDQASYNRLILFEHIGCPTGCAAVAAGQVMNYYQYPDKYWNGQSSLDQLIYDLGVSFKMQYTPKESYATPENIEIGLKKDFNYIVSQSNYNFSSLGNHIASHHEPALVGGTDKTSGDGPMWVCDGYQRYDEYYEYCMHYMIKTGDHYHYGTNGIFYVSSIPGTIIRSPYLHMNWGWFGGNGNGWFLNLNVESPSGPRDYSTKTRIFFLSPIQ